MPAPNQRSYLYGLSYLCIIVSTLSSTDPGVYAVEVDKDIGRDPIPSVQLRQLAN